MLLEQRATFNKYTGFANFSGTTVFRTHYVRHNFKPHRTQKEIVIEANDQDKRMTDKLFWPDQKSYLWDLQKRKLKFVAERQGKSRY